MHVEVYLKRIISLLLALTLAFMTPGCNKKDPSPSGENDSGKNDTPNDNASTAPTIVVPQYKDYGRGTVDFDKIVYSRPNLSGAISSFNEATELIRANNVTFSEQISAIRSLEDIYTSAESMYAIAEIYTKADSSVSFWKDEFLYISSNYPAFVKSVEDLLVACAASEHKSAFETEYFGYSLDEYKDGGSYTDELVLLLEQEALKEAEYSSLSTATVSIRYESVAGFIFEGTVDEVYAQAKEKFGNDSTQYKNATLAINDLYNQKVSELSRPIYVELLKIRHLIADELGYDSYAHFAYENMGYDYSPDDMQDLLRDIAAYVTPVAERLNSITFESYFQKNNQPRLDKVQMLNTMYEVYGAAGAELSDSYSYMLQHKLYNVSPSTENRYNGAFSVYIESNNSPFVFMSSSGFIRDFTTLAHEFGHFYDGYVNYGSDVSVDLAEVSSQALEYLSVLRLRSKLKLVDYEYLEYLTVYTALNSVMLRQSFYAAFEHKAYGLEYDQITVKKLNEITNEAFLEVYGRELENGQDAFRYVIIPHTILYPFYVESYVSSAIPALEMFFMESYRTGEVGKGFETYQLLVSREGDVAFTEQLEKAGLSSPFEQGTVKKIANLIHYQILGKDYFTYANSDVDAA